MATKVYMEALSPTMEEGRLVTWLKAEGDEVKEGDVLAEVETDKATMELAARGSGVLRKRFINEGDTANVGVMIAIVAKADEDISALEGGGTSAPAPAAEAPKAEVPKAETAAPAAEAPKAEPAQAAAPAAAAAPAPAEAAQGEGGRVKASPLARRLAAEAGLQVGAVQGTGPGGRVIRRDIQDAVARGGQQAEAQASAPAQAAAQPAAAAVAPTTDARFREHPISQMRKAIARRLAQSIGPVPTFYLTVEVDMGEAMALRGRINERFAKEGIKTSPNDLVIKAVSMALRRHPFVNAAWTGDSIHLYEQVHIGVAVAIEEGLITPVIRDADRKGVGEISAEVKELAGRAREKKLKPEEFTGSTFSISNLGMFGIEEFTAIINPPEAAILAVGAIGPKVVVDDSGEMVVRQRMRMTLSCDHRVIDGATGAAFLQTLKQYLEEPMMMVA
ncbi:pyruvate dehydrogenase complex dihydrolipoamide acetyltransferase [Longimicrobium terrae]|uniref:Acetyltransferase component of pyruvate dehydrogenase complex n=1 Tax=Longimicrobium terrae TaxID=1639882 RepID=A0A841GY53_9BACT|nr:pyruvate dehydrogenase complex dihydrolipoamide acetyltransferase [Longimicrobium terrae]MBB4636299.1 pyruvate dehydrogenase E2 component (dihydrolipoamide acetyltransferase) [Longimicrobium terrae]MBB6070695.1 pyruvate dehydrogenase E2 component (dihydrolipoamide acetyltransferase) [Longimicrobium terrae]NNC29676.1 pyruvate dehydrogenase complex dihydrolipoamide acetyltransferase [Longimicrobium terrae]